MDMIKARKGNEKHRFHEVPDLQKFRKNEIFQENIENFLFFEFFKEERQDNQGMKRHSTSPPCGNLVDGLPHDCLRKQWLSPADLGPHKMMNQCKISSSYQGLLDEMMKSAENLSSSAYRRLI